MEVLTRDLFPIEVPAQERTSFIKELLTGLQRAYDAKEERGHFDAAEACRQMRKLVSFV